MLRENLSRVHPELAKKIRSVNTNKLIFCPTRLGELNLKLTAKGRSWYFHSNYDPYREARRWLSGLELEEVEVLYVYGVGCGYSFGSLTPWLRSNGRRMLVYIEDDLRVLYRLFETEQGAEILDDDQVELYYMSKNEECHKFCQEVAVHYAGRPFLISALSYYCQQKEERFDRIETFLMHFSRFK
ncbi:motility associated factor glycosyltransferase family protein [Simkania negevensis]|uniref:Motility associated factor glycosyltransferase family protein n=1 Tax=Simkania negevensis TaxID=83561 RepID=A0ABS3AQZ1_9BACT|nr:motility associated factor glycosyltransferase family protein [Simkania negevensis]